MEKGVNEKREGIYRTHFAKISLDPPVYCLESDKQREGERGVGKLYTLDLLLTFLSHQEIKTSSRNTIFGFVITISVLHSFNQVHFVLAL